MSESHSHEAAGSASEDVFLLPASLGQERFWALDRLDPGNPTWNVPVRFRLQGPLNAEFLQRAFNYIVRRHEILRTHFQIVDGRPAQVIIPSLVLEVPVHDVRRIPKPERDSQVDRISFEEARRRFDLTTGPLLRVSLIRVEDEEHVLLVSPHHTIADYLSIGLISNELGAVYETFSRGVEPSLPDPALQYGDFAIWQQEQLEGDTVRTELDYWKKQLDGLPQLEVPTDRPRLDSPTYDATITSILLPVSLTDSIREIANREGATFFNTMLSVLAMVLHQYTGQTDFGVATQVSGRTNVELETLIGLFINTVVLRMNLGGDPTFPQLLARVQDTGIQALANQNVRFEQVLQNLRPAEYPSHHTLFRVNFICQRDPVKPQEFAGIKLTVIPSKSQGALYDLHVFLVMRNEGWRLACEYNTDLFEAATITTLLADYKNLLERIVENPNRPISSFPQAEGAKRLKRNPVTTPEAVRDARPSEIQNTGPLPNAPLKSASPAAETPAAELPAEDFSASVPEETYAMPTSAAQRRFWVLEQFTPNNPALHMRACVRVTGSLSVPALETSLRKLIERHETLRTTFMQRNEEILQLISSAVEVTLPITSLERVAETDREASLWKEIRAEATAAFDLDHGPLVRARLIRLQPQEHVLVICMHHILCDGWSQRVIQRDLWSIYEAVAEGREPVLPELSVQYGDFVHWQQEWLSTPAASEQIEFWRNQLEPLPPPLNLPTESVADHLRPNYGPMETLLLSKDLVRDLKRLGQSREATTFMVMLGGYCAFLNRMTGQEEILVGSPVANRKPETEGLIGPFAGPIALRINLAGNPSLGEVICRVRDATLAALSNTDVPFEVLLETLNPRSNGGRNPLSQCYFFYQVAFLEPRGLKRVTVSPLPDFGLGTHFELQMGLLERREGVRAQLEYNPDLFTSGTVKSYLNTYERVLRAVAGDPNQRLSELPVTGPPREDAPPAVAQAQTVLTAPHNEVERKLTAIWEDLLRVRAIGLEHNYFELGGNSILALRLFQQIEKVFHVRLPLSTLIAAPTLGQLARIIGGGADEPGWSPLVEIQNVGTRPPFFCVHAAGGNVLVYRELAKYTGPDQPFYGLQAQGLDGRQDPLARVEDMASLYIREILKVQPSGPYHLGGYCMGGTIALEMAQQLRQQGKSVALLALFDTMNWAKIPKSGLAVGARHRIQRVLAHLGNFSLLNFNEKLEFVSEKIGVLRSRAPVWRGMIARRIFKGDVSKSESRLLARLWETNDQALETYVPKPYAGVITDFRPFWQYAKYRSAEYKWARLAVEGEKIVNLPVYPAGMLLEPFVKKLGAALRTAIDEAAFSNLEVSAQPRRQAELPPVTAVASVLEY